MKLKLLLYGISTFLPGSNKYRSKGTGGTVSARYCYSIWLRHLVMAKSNGLDPYPKIVAELGPGDSLGIGLAALISGCEKYFAFDVVEHANTERNINIFDDLVELFKKKENIPGPAEFPNAKPFLKSYDFPSDILDEKRLQHAVEGSRLKRIKDSINNFRDRDSLIQYKVPWYDASIPDKESVDMVYSQAVLEYVNDLKNVYRSMRLWLKSTGYISHQIDFKCHETADEWNGHWAYSDLIWKLIKGNRPFFLNREPHSKHTAALSEEGFRVICDIKNKLESNLTLNDLAPKFRSISNDDLTTSGAFIQAVKNY